MPFSISRGIAFALSATTGMPAVSGSFRRIRNASIPLIPGKLTSIKITSGWCVRAKCTPILPSTALSNRISARRSINLSTSFRFAGLSST